MSRTVEAVDLDLVVYGRRQVAYSVEGQAPVDFESVVHGVTLQQVTAFESEVAAYSVVVQKRKEKLEKIGEALSILKGVVGRFEKGGKSDDKVYDERLKTVKSTFDAYGLNLEGYSEGWDDIGAHFPAFITRKGANLAVQVAESEIDLENAEMDEVTTVMQGVINKRNNAYSTCTQLQRKTANTANTLIKGFSI